MLSREELAKRRQRYFKLVISGASSREACRVAKDIAKDTILTSVVLCIFEKHGSYSRALIPGLSRGIEQWSLKFSSLTRAIQRVYLCCYSLQ